MHIDELVSLLQDLQVNVPEKIAERLDEYVGYPEDTLPVAQSVAKALRAYADLIEHWGDDQYDRLYDEREEADRKLEEAIDVFEEA